MTEGTPGANIAEASGLQPFSSTFNSMLGIAERCDLDRGMWVRT